MKKKTRSESKSDLNGGGSGGNGGGGSGGGNTDDDMETHADFSVIENAVVRNESSSYSKCMLLLLLYDNICLYVFFSHY